MGRPLIAHTIQHAKDSGVFNYIAVSSDSRDILDAAKKEGVDFLIKRPDDLSSDTAPKIPAIRHCAQEVEKLSENTFDIFVDLDCTSPLRTSDDIIAAIDLLRSHNHSNIFSVTPARRSPYFDVVEHDLDWRVKPCCVPNNPIHRRQDTPDTYDLNASIYVWNRKTLMESDSLYNEQTGLYIMPHERSIEIDEELDFIYAEMLMDKNAK